MTITLFLNVLFLISNWMKHHPTRISVPPPAPEIVLLHLINLGLYFNLLKHHCDITLIDAPISYNDSIFILFILTLYNIALSEFTSSMVTSLMTFSSQLESESVPLCWMDLMSCSACSIEYMDS